MIITPHFVWTHMAKTGGSVVHKILELLNDPEIILDPMTGEWSDYKRHEPFWMRSQKIGFDITHGKYKALTIRRLPSWILSMSEFKFATCGFEYERNDLINGLFKHEKRDMNNGILNDPGEFEISPADDALAFYEPESIDIWWTQENLANDVINTNTKYYQIDEPLRNQMSLIRINENKYNRDLKEHFSNTELEQLYHNCPLWAQYEKKIYGDLLA